MCHICVSRLGLKLSTSLRGSKLLSRDEKIALTVHSDNSPDKCLFVQLINQNGYEFSPFDPTDELGDHFSHWANSIHHAFLNTVIVYLT